MTVYTQSIRFKLIISLIALFCLSFELTAQETAAQTGEASATAEKQKEAYNRDAAPVLGEDEDNLFLKMKAPQWLVQQQYPLHVPPFLTTPTHVMNYPATQSSFLDASDLTARSISADSRSPRSTE